MTNDSERKLEPKIRKLLHEGFLMNTCFLITHVPDPKTNKRIKVFKEYGNVNVICTRRKSQDIWEPTFGDVKHYIFDVDLPTAKHILKRCIVSSGYQMRAFTKLNELKPDVIYADGLDSLLIASKYKKKNKVKVFYDVADLRETYIEEPKRIVKKIINDAVKFIEKRSFSNVDYLVVTSEKFYKVYYHRLISKDRVIFIPNAPDKDVFENYKKKFGGDFTIGFIGGIRYLDQMKMLVDAAKKCDCRVIFAGAGGTNSDFENISEYCAGKKWVQFTGKYDYREEIAGIYGKVDCVYAVYNADNPNVRIALPNKLYEAVYCGLPIIVAKNTYLSEIVEKWGVGFSVSHKNITDLVSVLNELKNNVIKIREIEKNCKRIRDKCAVSHDSEKIGEKL